MVRYRLHTVFCSALVLSVILASAQTGEPRKAMVFQSESEEVLAVAPIAAGTVIKFTPDSIHVSNGEWQDEIDRLSVSGFALLPGFSSNLNINIATGADTLYPIEGAYVTLHSDDMRDFYGIVQISDGEGCAMFRNLPVGIYTASVRSDNTLLIPFEKERLVHSLNDASNLYMEERVPAPCSLDYELYEDEFGLTSVSLFWDLDKMGHADHLFENYIYSVWLNDELVGQTSETNFLLDGLAEGEYAIRISTTSGYGNHSVDYADISFIIKETNGITGIINETEAEYYDLNGLRIDPEKAASGIYIRRLPSGESRKILI